MSHVYLPHYAVLAHYYIPTDVPLQGDLEVAFLDHALLIFGLMRQTELFVARFQSRHLQSHSVWTVFVVAYMIWSSVSESPCLACRNW